MGLGPYGPMWLAHTCRPFASPVGCLTTVLLMWLHQQQLLLVRFVALVPHRLVHQLVELACNSSYIVPPVKGVSL